MSNNKIRLSGIFLIFCFVTMVIASTVLAQSSDDDQAENIAYVIGRFVMLISVILAVWVARDVQSKVGPNGKISFGTPLVWGICVFLIWIVFFPWYLVVRNDKQKYRKDSTMKKRGKGKR